MFELLIEPFVKEVVAAVIVLATALLTTICAKVVTFINTKNSQVKNTEIRETLERAAQEAYALVRQTMENEKNQEKIAHAIHYVSEVLKKNKINMSVNEIRAAIEKVVVDKKLNSQ